MNTFETPKMAKPVFIIADAILVLIAVAVLAYAKKPLEWGPSLVAVGCAMAGALLGLVPWLKEYQAAAKLTEFTHLSTALEQIQNLERIGRQVLSVTALLQSVQTETGKSAKSAKEMADKVALEAQDFAAALQKANDAERVQMKLEIEKLHRAEGDWLQVTTRLLDHAYALREAAVRSGKPEVIQQLNRFQYACYDIVRRVGIVPFVAEPNETFNPGLHQVADPNALPDPGSPIARTVATGFTYQGQLLRPAIVEIGTPPPPVSNPEPASAQTHVTTESFSDFATLTAVAVAAEEALKPDATPHVMSTRDMVVEQDIRSAEPADRTNRHDQTDQTDQPEPPAPPQEMEFLPDDNAALIAETDNTPTAAAITPEEPNHEAEKTDAESEINPADQSEPLAPTQEMEFLSDDNAALIAETDNSPATAITTPEEPSNEAVKNDAEPELHPTDPIVPPVESVETIPLVDDPPIAAESIPSTIVAAEDAEIEDILQEVRQDAEEQLSPSPEVIGENGEALHAVSAPETKAVPPEKTPPASRYPTDMELPLL